MTGSRFAVELRESNGSRMLTKHATGIVIDSTNPGGYAGGSFDLAREVNAPDFEDDAEIIFWDAQTGEQAGGGQLKNPGRDLSPSGQTWKMLVIGKGMAHAQERVVPYLIIDTRLEAFRPGAVSNARLEWRQGDKPESTFITTSYPGWTFVINPGALNSGYAGRLNHYDMEQYAKVGDGTYRTEIGGFAYRDTEGNGTNANRVQAVIAPDGGTANQRVVSDFGFDVPPPGGVGPSVHRRQLGNVAGSGIPEDWPVTGIGPSDNLPVTHVSIRYLRDSPSAPAPGVGGDDDWMHIWDLRVSALRLDREREPITAAGTYDGDPTSDYVLAHDALIDCWARFCPNFDLVNARIDETATFQHRDLVWPDGVSPYDVMAKLVELNPAFTWAVWEKHPNGLSRAEWRQYDDEVRYILPRGTEFSQQPSDAVDLEDAYVVGGGVDGDHYQVHHTNDPSQSTSSGAARTTKFDGKLLDADFDPAAAAVGQDTIDNSRLRASTARATVTGLAYDLQTGRLVNPWQILPGYLCLVPGVRSRIDLLNPRENDGAAILRVESNRHTVDAGSAVLELNSYTVDEAEAIANLLNAA